MNKGEKSYTIKRSATGLGLYAIQDIPANTKIIQYTGIILSKDEADEASGRYLIHLNDTQTLDGKPRTNTARYINHSCKPNSESHSTGRQVWVWAKKAIKAGEEITMDYGEEYFDEFIKTMGCKCKKCKSLKPSQDNESVS